jgi:hypothetical protein
VADELSSITAHATLAKFAESTRNKAHDLRDEAADLVEEEWEHWLKEAGAIQDPINSSHGASVMKDYFSGKPQTRCWACSVRLSVKGDWERQ